MAKQQPMESTEALAPKKATSGKITDLLPEFEGLLFILDELRKEISCELGWTGKEDN